LNENSGVTFSNTGLTLKTDNSSFLKTAAVKNKSEGRAIRMPQKDLFDLLFKLFDEYDYWSLKGIKERTKQPEVYLKETLDQIAVLIKKGPYALRYALKREYKELKDQERAAKLGELGLNDENHNEEDDEDENDEDIEMEDIV
jgi:transcription initiation factor TFIIF subunit beta